MIWLDEVRKTHRVEQVGGATLILGDCMEIMGGGYA